MKHIRNRKGFTLIEVLIVVVIIGILASLILPRMLAQPERAITAEAMNFLGVIRRAQEANAQPTGAYLDVDSGTPDGVTDPDDNWSSLGLQALSPASRFTYVCDSTGVPDNPVTPQNEATGATCTATRIGNADDNPRATGTIVMQVDTGFIIDCTDPYVEQGTMGEESARCT